MRGSSILRQLWRSATRRELARIVCPVCGRVVLSREHEVTVLWLSAGKCHDCSATLVVMPNGAAFRCGDRAAEQEKPASPKPSRPMAPPIT